MGDIADRAAPEIARVLEAGIAAARGIPMAKGEPGPCDFCGEDSPRLVKGACAPCRDKYRLDECATV